MPKLFILGAGFSKALYDEMPLLNDLSRNLDWNTLPVKRPEYKRFSHDIEQLLSYLYQEMPWKSSEEKHLDTATFYAISRQIADYIDECEQNAFKNAPPDWAMR